MYLHAYSNIFLLQSLYARSTASPRTLMSMATVLAGMLPPNNTPMKWNTKLNWQPIPIFSEPLDKDIVSIKKIEICKHFKLGYVR